MSSFTCRCINLPLPNLDVDRMGSRHSPLWARELYSPPPGEVGPASEVGPYHLFTARTCHLGPLEVGMRPRQAILVGAEGLRNIFLALALRVAHHI